MVTDFICEDYRLLLDNQKLWRIKALISSSLSVSAGPPTGKVILPNQAARRRCERVQPARICSPAGNEWKTGAVLGRAQPHTYVHFDVSARASSMGPGRTVLRGDY